MLRLLTLYLPVIFPSWRFFEDIGPSARVEYRVDGGPWIEATRRPAQIAPMTLIQRLFWNPDWNELLFLVSCAERLMVEPTRHSVDEINARLARRIDRAGLLQFRLVFRCREKGGVVSSVDYESVPVQIAAPLSR